MIGGGSVNYLKFLITGDSSGLQAEVQKARKTVTGFVDDVSSRMKNLVGILAGAMGVSSLLGGLKRETIAAEQEQAQLAAALLSTKSAAGLSQQQLNAMAADLAKSSNFSAGQVNQAQARLLSYVNVVGSQFPRALRAAADMGTRLEMGLNLSMESVARALDKPSEGMRSLQRQGFKFTDSQIEMAERLENVGRIAEAQEIVFAELEASYGGAAAAARDTLGGAYQQVGKDIDNLLTSDTQSMPALRKSVEDLHVTLSDEKTISAFQTFTGWIIQVGAVAIQSAANLITFLNANDRLSILAGTDKFGKMKADAQAYSAHLQRLVDMAERYQEAIDRGDRVAMNQRNLDRVREKITEVQGQMSKASQDLKDYADEAAPAALATDAVTAAQQRLGGALGQTKKDKQAAEAAAKALAGKYQDLVKSIEEKTREQQLEIEGGEKATEADKLRIKFTLDLSGALKGLGAAERANIDARLKTLKQLEKENEARKKVLKLAEEERKYRVEWTAAQGKIGDELLASNEALRDEIELIGLNAEQQRVVLEQRQMAIILSKEQQLAEMERSASLTGTMTAEHALLQQEIELLRERLGLTSAKVSREASAEAVKATQTEWQRGIEQIGQSLTDQLMAAGQSFGELMKNLGRTMVFRPIIQATMQLGTNAVSGMLGLPGSNGGQSGGAGMGILNNMGTLGAGAQAMWGLLPGASAASLAGANAVGLAGGDALGALIAGNGGWAGVGSSFGAGLSALGTALPWIGAALAVISILKGGIFGSRGANHSGGVYSTGTDDWDEAAKQALGKDAWGNALGDFTKRGNKELGTQLGTTVDALIDVYKSLAKYAGGTAKDIDIAAGFAINPKHGDEDVYGYFQIIEKATGNILSSYKNRGLGNDPEKGLAQFFADMGGELIGVIKQADIPSWMRNVFDDMGEDIDLEKFNAALQVIELTGSAIEGWTRNIKNFGMLGEEAIAKLIKESGGITTLVSSMDAFYGSFYSERERLENAAKAVDKTLAGLKLEIDPRMGQQAKEQFRQLIERAMAEGDVELLAKLLPLSQEFAAIADAAGRALDALKSDRVQLEAEYLRASGQTEAYRATLRRLATEGMSEAERAAWDFNDALRADIAALDQRASLELKWLELNGDTAELRRRELAALDPSNRALQERIWALEDERKASAEAVQAAEAARTAAYDLFQRAVDRDRQALQQQSGDLQSSIAAIASAVSLLDSAAKDLWGTVDSTQQWMAAQGMVYLEQALAGVRTGRKISEYGDLSAAVQATRSGINSGVYATDFERQRDALVWAGKLSELGKLGGDQLSIEERSLRAVQAQLDVLETLSRRADEIVNGTQTLTGTVQSYFEKLLGSSGGGADGGTGGAAWGGSAGGDGGGKAQEAKYKQVRMYGHVLSYDPIIDPALIAKLDMLWPIYHSFDNTGDVRGLLEAIKAAGGTMSNLSTLSGFFERDWIKAGNALGIPAFERGGMHSGGLRLVGERGWEIEAAGPARYWNQQQLGQALQGGGDSDNTALVGLFGRFDERLSRMERHAERTAASTAALPRLVEQFDRVSAGGNLLRTRAVA